MAFNKKGECELPGKCIDIGCGDGAVTVELLQKTLPDLQILAVDLSEKMVEFARKSYSKTGIKFRQMDIATDDLDQDLKGSFDYAFSVYCLQRVPNQRKALRNIYDLIKVGGTCILSHVLYDSIFEVNVVQFSQPKWATFVPDVHTTISPLYFSKNPFEEYKKLLEDVGFKSVVVNTFDHTLYWKNLAKLKDAMRAIDLGLSRIPEELREEYMNDFMDIMVETKRFRRASGTGVTTQHTNLRVFAYKI